MSIRKVILHLGMPKAGSTSIQDTLFNNTAILEENGFRYLTEWGKNHLGRFRRLFSPFPVIPISSGYFGKPLSKKNREIYKNYFIEQMLNAINSTDCKTFILSGEYFHELWHDSTIENIKDFLDLHFLSNGIDVDIIYIIRNPLTWLISYLQQISISKICLNKDHDFFTEIVKQYEGIFNLQRCFFDSLTLLKFEDACLDKDGLVGCFLKNIGFPEEKLKSINIHRMKESKSMEVMEFTDYINAMESFYKKGNTKGLSLNRRENDLSKIRDIKGIKFDLPYDDKVCLWKQFQNATNRLKESTGIDYTNYKVSIPQKRIETYAEGTIQGFIDGFPKLSFVLQKHFLDFFEKKYRETSLEKFKQLYSKGSVPWKIYNSKNAFLSLLSLRTKNMLYNIKMSILFSIPQTIKVPLKRYFRERRKKWL